MTLSSANWLKVYLSLYFSALANQLKGIIHAATIQPRRKGKFWSVKGQRFLQNSLILLLEAMGRE